MNFTSDLYSPTGVYILRLSVYFKGCHGNRAVNFKIVNSTLKDIYIYIYVEFKLQTIRFYR